MATLYVEAQCEPPRRQCARRGRRSSISLPALILLFGERHSAQLHNLSRRGAMIQSSAPASPNDQIMLTCGTIQARGRVVWTKERSFGIEFHAPIEEEEIVRQLDRSNAVASRRLRVADGTD